MTYTIQISHGDLQPYQRYINEAVGLKCFPDLLGLGVFPNAKKITESMAAYNAVRKARMFDWNDPEVALVAVGDGNTPRTAALFAFRSRWQCWSVDPRLKADWAGHEPHGVRRLRGVDVPIEDTLFILFRKLVVVCVHSHAKLDQALLALPAPQRLVVAIPCCVPQVRERPADYSYVDKGIWSPQNQVLVWKDEV